MKNKEKIIKYLQIVIACLDDLKYNCDEDRKRFKRTLTYAKKYEEKLKKLNFNTALFLLKYETNK